MDPLSVKILACGPAGDKKFYRALQSCHTIMTSAVAISNTIRSEPKTSPSQCITWCRGERGISLVPNYTLNIVPCSLQNSTPQQ